MSRVLLITLLVTSCAKSEPPARDAATDSLPADGGATGLDSSVSFVVDFAVENCPSFDPEKMTCTGRVPLSLRFAPLASSAATYLWDFGDATALDSSVAPAHVYIAPGTYTVQVIATGIGGGLARQTRTAFVVATASPAGGPCDTDIQCADGQFCLCPTSAACVGGPVQGICTSICQSGQCAPGLSCTNLRTAKPPVDGVMPWQAALCLPSCTTDNDCITGLHCRVLPPGTTGGSWVRGCFGDAPADIGQSCVDASGRLRDDYCTSGLCAAMGAKGLCSASCATTYCPPGSTCAILGDGRNLCLRPCSGGFACTQDPLLMCVFPGPGERGFTLANPTAGGPASSYCAPKPCTSDDTCLPAGSCVQEIGGSHCAPRTQ